MWTPDHIIAWILCLTGSAYAAWMLLLSWGWIRIPVISPGPRQSKKMISVVVPFRDESSNIPKLIHDLKAQDYPASEWELIFIDDASSDDSFEVARKMLQSSGIHHRVLKLADIEKKGAKKRALEFGIRHAKGDLIITTDADCRMGPGWIRSMAMPFTSNATVMVSGPVAMTGSNTASNIFQRMEFCGLIASGAGGIGLGLPFMCNGANLAFRKTAFDHVGGYRGNETYRSGDDMFLLHKMKQEYGTPGIKFCKQRSAVVYTETEQGIRNFLSQRLRWVSKSKGYTDRASLAIAVLVYVFNLALLAGLIGGIWHTGLLAMAWAFLIVKMMADLPLLALGLSFVRQKHLLFAYLPASLVNIVYVSLVGFLGNVYRVEWKGRKV